MSLRRSVATAVAVATVSLASAAWGSPWQLKPGEFYSELSGNFFSARTYLQNSNSDRIQLGGNLEERVLRSHTELGWKKHASVWFDIPYVNRTFALNQGGAVTSTGLGDLEVGLRFGAHVGKLPLGIELGWGAPLGGNRKLFPGVGGSGGMDGTSYVAQATGPVRDSSAFFDSGLQSLSAAVDLGGTVGKKTFWTLGGGFKTHFLTAGARSATDDRYADFLTGNGSLGYWLGTHVLLTGTYLGEWARSQGNPYDRIATPIAGDHGPDLEPSSMLLGPRLTFRVDERMDVFTGTWHTMSGRNVLHTDQFYAGIAWKHTGLDRLAGAFGGTRAH
jgi:hypothetical protein